jgi:transposase
MLLLPEALDDYTCVDNPVRFVDAFVDGLDLVEAGFAGVQAMATGRPGYAPGDLLKLYIYGYPLSVSCPSVFFGIRLARKVAARHHWNAPGLGGGLA